MDTTSGSGMWGEEGVSLHLAGGTCGCVTSCMSELFTIPFNVCLMEI